MTQENTNNKAKYNVFQVANCFIEIFKENKRQLTHMQLQKLVYYAYAFYLYDKNKELFESKFHPWAFGPVDADLYKEIKSSNNSTFNIIYPLSVESFNCSCDSPELKEISDYINKAFGTWTAYELSELTHQPGSAWDIARQRETDILDNYDIKKEVSSIIDKVKANS